jgi:hypothetical protein
MHHANRKLRYVTYYRELTTLISPWLFRPAHSQVAVLANNTPRPGHRAMIFSINSMGNIGGIISAVSAVTVDF